MLHVSVGASNTPAIKHHKKKKIIIIFPDVCFDLRYCFFSTKCFLVKQSNVFKTMSGIVSSQRIILNNWKFILKLYHYYFTHSTGVSGTSNISMVNNYHVYSA